MVPLKIKRMGVSVSRWWRSPAVLVTFVLLAVVAACTGGGSDKPPRDDRNERPSVERLIVDGSGTTQQGPVSTTETTLRWKSEHATSTIKAAIPTTASSGASLTFSFSYEVRGTSSADCALGTLPATCANQAAKVLSEKKENDEPATAFLAPKPEVGLYASTKASMYSSGSAPKGTIALDAEADVTMRRELLEASEVIPLLGRFRVNAQFLFTAEGLFRVTLPPDVPPSSYFLGFYIDFIEAMVMNGIWPEVQLWLDRGPFATYQCYSR